MDVRLIATDMDGTLLGSDHRISPRNSAAFAAARDAGLAVLAISGRQAYSIGGLVAGSPLEGFAIGSNGSVAVDLAARTILFEELLDLDAQQAVTRAMLEHFPDAHVRSVRDAGNTHVAQHGYTGDEEPASDLAPWPVTVRYADLDDVLAEPSVKLVIKHPDPTVAPETMLEVARDLAVPGTHPTTSGAPFLEIGRAGVSKATALARFAASRGIDATQVVAFGDNLNDVEMLQWAGLGVAMGNAVPGAMEAADEVTLHHDEDGVAVVIERLLGLRSAR